MSNKTDPGSAVETITIDKIPVEVSRIALGTWAMGGWMWGGSDETECIRTIHEAIDRGITMIDTAPVYGFGRSEGIVGKALATGRRRRVVIATKAGLDWRDEKPFRNAARARILRGVEGSLRRLRTDIIDLYQLHWPDTNTPVEETAAAMLELQESEKIRAIGVSNFTAAQLELFCSLSPLQTTQPPYNLFEREIERKILPYCVERNIVILAYGVLCRGLLTGRITEATRYIGDDLRKHDPKFQIPRLRQYLNAVDQLDRFAQDNYGKRVIHLALRWVLDRAPSTIAIWGARRSDQLTPVRDVMGWRLDRSAMDEIDAILSNAVKDPVGPEFMAPPEPLTA